MRRIAKRFAIERKGSKALVAYLTAGYPDLERTRDLVLALDGAGVDVLELGIPFSDPTADGPAIQKASQEALRSGTTLSRVLHLLGDLRKIDGDACGSFSYYNPILCLRQTSGSPGSCGGGGRRVLVVDLPLKKRRS